MSFLASRSVIAGLLLALALAVPAGGAGAEHALPGERPDGWWQLDLDADGFRALFPGKPLLVRESTETIVGKVKASRYVYETPDAFYSVERHHLPRLSTMLAPAGMILNRAKDEILKSRKGVEVSYDEVDASEDPTRVLHYHDEGNSQRIATTELRLVGRDLFLITAQPAEGEDKPSAIRRFLDSFKIVGR